MTLAAHAYEIWCANVGSHSCSRTTGHLLNSFVDICSLLFKVNLRFHYGVCRVYLCKGASFIA